MKLEPFSVTHIRFIKSAPKVYLVTYYTDGAPTLETYYARDVGELLKEIANTLNLSSTVCLEHYDYKEYSTVELRDNWKVYYKLKEKILYTFFYILLFLVLYLVLMYVL